MSEQHPSRIYIEGKRIAKMREICEDAFEQSFLSVEVKLPDRIFLVRVSDDANIEKLKEFTQSHKLCIIEVFPRMTFRIYRGQKQLAPANKK